MLKVAERGQLADVFGYFVEDGKEMKLDLNKLKIQDIQNEVDRHSRGWKRAEDLAGN